MVIFYTTFSFYFFQKITYQILEMWWRNMQAPLNIVKENSSIF